ncbi:MAG: adenylate/guanylate cyclase domain-containing protein [Gammaproteobacteria bacterium]|nr:adenylate/guanylate cyclase domain-containing protein [Gammaproteobacteria bacterium]
MNEGQTRRLQAILAADVVGYSRLMNGDEEGTLARLKVLEREVIDPSVAAHEGQVVKRMGDGVLATFPSAVTALRAARAIREQAARQQADEAEPIVFRIGLNVGDVLVTDDDIYGDGVNIASRLEGLADPGGVTLSGAVYEYVRAQDPGPFDSLGERRVKNIAHPVRVYRVRFDDSPALSAVTRQGLPRLLAAAGGVLLLAIALGLAWAFWPGAGDPGPETAGNGATEPTSPSPASTSAGKAQAGTPVGDVVESRAAWPEPEPEPAKPPPTPPSGPSTGERLLDSLAHAVEDLGEAVKAPPGKSKTPPGQAKAKNR